VVCLYPFVFDLRSPSAGPGNLSTVMMQHFVSYIRGAHELEQNGVVLVILQLPSNPTHRHTVQQGLHLTH
jgi:hypothetical protein